MSNYYEACMKEIRCLLDVKRLTEAEQKIKEELSMPYIPKEFEEKLKCFEKELLAQQIEKKLSEDEIEAYFDMDEMHQLIAVKALSESNMRRYPDLIQQGFDKAKSVFVKISLMEACIDQQLNEEFRVEKDGLDIYFVPCSCVHPTMSDGLEKCLEYLRQWLENDDPSLLKLCVESAVKETYLHLPFEIDEEESEAMAYEIVMYVSMMMGSQNEMKKALSEKNASQKGGFELLLYSNTI